MPRSNHRNGAANLPTPLVPAAAAAPPPVRVIPADAVFQLGELQAVLGLSKHTLRREVRLGRLRVSKRAGRYWIVGRWVHQWLDEGEATRGQRDR
jgi:hypothetical protein